MYAFTKSRPDLTIFFQLNPLNPTIGGIQTCINYVIKYAPEAFNIRLVGIGDSATGPIGQWQSLELHGRSFEFMPLLKIEDDNVRGQVPTTVKYAAALAKYQFKSDFLQFHRIEPTMMTPFWQGHKILYIHNDIFQEVKGRDTKGGILWKKMPWAYFAMERMLVGQFETIFSCNSDAAAMYRQRYPHIADRVSYLPNTFDGDLFYPLTAGEKHQQRQKLAHQLNLSSETRFILFAGRLHPQKNPHLLVQAMEKLQDPHAHLLVVGKGELKEEVEAEIKRLGIGHRVTLVGPVKQKELADLYRIAEMFVLTSAYEGLARGSLEALACGAPVVTTRAGETPKFLTPNGGIVCDDRTPTAIAAAWQQVLDAPDYYSSQAATAVVRPYAAAKVVNDIYSSLLSRWQAEQLTTAVV